MRYITFSQTYISHGTLTLPYNHEMHLRERSRSGSDVTREVASFKRSRWGDLVSYQRNGRALPIIFQVGAFTVWGPVAYGGPTHALSMAGRATSPSSTTSISLTTFFIPQPLTKVSHSSLCMSRKFVFSLPLALLTGDELACRLTRGSRDKKNVLMDVNWVKFRSRGMVEIQQFSWCS